ncbi:MAG: hypothetical protein A2136_06960 [Chloroflexi bacterium RBG_16_54_11]|nr:MAG: hypothetical protein A2136_06960 [Chloroflexi bacterium RBG_16_54_11]
MVPLPDVKRASRVRPTIQTPFHIDFNWWQLRDRDWRVFLQSLLCPDHQQAFAELPEDHMVDFVDPQTAEVQRVDGLQHVLITHCAKRDGFISPRTTLVDAIFRIFMANGNIPMTPMELSQESGRSSDLILRVLTGERIYRGLRPVMEG